MVIEIISLQLYVFYPPEKMCNGIYIHSLSFYHDGNGSRTNGYERRFIYVFIDTSRNGKPVYDPIVNQSLDNYLVNDLKLPGHGLIMYVNQPAVIVGVNQNAYAEVNMPYLKEKASN